MFRSVLIKLLLITLLASCGGYNQDVMFKYDELFDENNLQSAVDVSLSNYRIQINDLLSLDLYTNKGELIIDPNFEFARQLGGGTNQNNQGLNQRRQVDYLVRVDSTVRFPLLGDVKLVGYTLQEAQDILGEMYNDYYKESFAVINYLNKRVILLGGATGTVIPLPNEGMSLLEVLALNGGVDRNAKSQNIKVIRGNYTNPEVYEIDLSTISGMKQSVIPIHSGDVIYIDPWRRAWFQSLGDINTYMTFVTNTLTFIFFINSLNN